MKEGKGQDEGGKEMTETPRKESFGERVLRVPNEYF